MDAAKLRKQMPVSALIDRRIVLPAIGSAFVKLDPRSLIRNPVMFVLEIVSALTTVTPQGRWNIAATNGGTLVIKDIASKPGWKRRWNAVHDRIVSGDRVICRDPEEMAGVLASLGLDVRAVKRVSRWQPYPHYLVVAQRIPVAAPVPGQKSVQAAV